MALWCCGSQSFLARIQQITSAKWLAACADAAPEDIVIVDLDEPADIPPDEAVQRLSQSGCTVVAVCEPQFVSRVVGAVKLGADRVILKPVRASDLEAYTEVNLPESMVDIDRWRKAYAGDVVGESSALRAAIEMAAQTGEFDCPVLITGESGTGKELLAAALHRSSPRHKAAFVPVNCPAVPKELVESELFGHSKGAFTGATVARMGRFAAADQGTLFLDEIGEMDLNIQSKLLRVLQDYKITPVGESRQQQVDVRIVAATNRDLEQEVTRGTFREDLFYRLNVVQIHLPGLKERREDIPLLIDHFLERISAQRGVPQPILTPQVRERLVGYHWPGNIRQLRNLTERLIILHRGRVVDLKHLPPNIVQADDDGEELWNGINLPPTGIDLRGEVQRFEEMMIRKALTATGGNKNQAAKILGLNRTTLVEKLRKRPLSAAS